MRLNDLDSWTTNHSPRNVPYPLVAFISLVSALVFSAGPTRSAERIRVSGDESLLELVRAAQLTNRLKYQQGEVTAKVHSGYLGGDMPFEVDVDASVAWGQDGCYWSYSARERDVKRGTVDEIRELIETPSQVIWYSREHKWMAIAKPAERTCKYRDELRLRPDQQWFRLEGVADWADLLDPEPAKKPRGAAVAEIAVAMEGADRIVIQRRCVTDSVLRIVASLAADGNIVEYEGHGQNGMQWRRGTYDWERDKDGHLYVRSYQWVSTYLGNRRRPERTFSMQVTAWTMNPSIPANRFELSSLGAPPDTMIDEIGPGGTRSRRRLGGDVARDVQGELDTAARKVREGRLAAPR